MVNTVMHCSQKVHLNLIPFHSYTGVDPIGIELSGALKNIYAIAAGMSDGLGFENNTRASKSYLSLGLNPLLIVLNCLE